MDTDGIEALRSELRRVIGIDRVYITASDVERHFDPITLATVYAGIIFLDFIKGAATKLGERAEKAAWTNASTLLAKVNSPETTDNAHQLAQITAADQVARLLGEALSAELLKEFLDAGEQAVQARLVRDGFPSEKAQRIAADFATIIERRAKD